MQQGGDIVLIGQLQAGIVPERPFDRDLDRLAGEEGRRGRDDAACRSASTAASCTVGNSAARKAKLDMPSLELA